MHKVSETEIWLLKVLWEHGEQTVRQIAEAMYGVTKAAPSAVGNSAVGTTEIGSVHSLLNRLEKKKLVRRSRRAHAHLFSAKVTFEEIAGGELEAIAKKN